MPPGFVGIPRVRLGALGRHLGSSWRSWALSWLILGLLGAILAHLKALGRLLAAKDVAR